MTLGHRTLGTGLLICTRVTKIDVEQKLEPNKSDKIRSLSSSGVIYCLRKYAPVSGVWFGFLLCRPGSPGGLRCPLSHMPEMQTTCWFQCQKQCLYFCIMAVYIECQDQPKGVTKLFLHEYSFDRARGGGGGGGDLGAI